MAELTLQKQYYMKGRTRHWFWGAFAALLFSAVSQIAITVLTGMLSETQPASTVLLIVTLINVLATGIMVMVLLAYGLCNTVAIYRVVFIILACCQALGAVGSFFTNYNTINNAYHIADPSTVLILATGVLYVAITLVWVVCLLIITFGRTASGALRVAAVLLAAYTLLMAVYNLVFMAPVSLSLYRQMGAQAYAAFLAVFNITQNAVYIALHAFFFGAMSFSRKKQPKPARQTAAA